MANDFETYDVYYTRFGEEMIDGFPTFEEALSYAMIGIEDNLFYPYLIKHRGKILYHRAEFVPMTDSAPSH